MDEDGSPLEREVTFRIVGLQKSCFEARASIEHISNAESLSPSLRRISGNRKQRQDDPRQIQSSGVRTATSCVFW